MGDGQARFGWFLSRLVGSIPTAYTAQLRARRFNMKTAIIAALLALSSIASAEETRPAKPVACQDFAVATTTDGSKVAICAAAKAGGKPTLLRVFEVVTVAGQRLAVGFR